MTTEAPIRVLIADDHPVVREGLASLIDRRPDMKVVAEASTGLEAVEQFEQHRPDVALIDLRMPGLDGAQVVVAIRKRAPSAAVVVLTTFAGDEDVYRTLRAGAKAYLLKDAPRDELIACIRAVHRGEGWLSPLAAARLTARLGAPDLSPREQDVLQLIVRGSSNKEISAILGVAEGTVKAHASRLFTKLGVTSRTEAATSAVRRGIVKLG